MKNIIGAMVFFIIAGTVHAQCGCRDEKQWTADISIRENTLQKVIVTGNKDAILAVYNLILADTMQAMTDSLTSDDANCTKMDSAFADESKVEAKMIKDYVQSLKKKEENNQGSMH
jgi:hypothetical protein